MSVRRWWRRRKPAQPTHERANGTVLVIAAIVFTVIGLVIRSCYGG